jgi:heparin binding hemagglutinin HbhA
VIIMAVTFPTKFDVREARDQAGKAVSDAVDPLRAPSLALLGLGDYAVASAQEAVARVQAGATEVQARVEDLPSELQELRSKLTTEDFRRLADAYLAAVRGVYEDLVKRGTGAYSKIKAQPQVKQALSTVDSVSTELESRLEDTVEEFRVRGENVLAGVTKQTRSVGERAARYTQQTTGQAAEVLTETSTEVAAELKETGDEVASETRSASRKAAARTAPKKQGPKNAPKSAATTAADKRAPKN